MARLIESTRRGRPREESTDLPRALGFGLRHGPSAHERSGAGGRAVAFLSGYLPEEQGARPIPQTRRRLTVRLTGILAFSRRIPHSRGGLSHLYPVSGSAPP